MADNELRDKLELQLGTLKRNRENVPLEELMTRYKKGYSRLCREIGTLVSQYVSNVAFRGLRLRKDLCPEAMLLAGHAIHASGIRQKISAAVFAHHDIARLDSLLPELRGILLAALGPIYARHAGLFLMGRCLKDPPSPPLFYNDAGGQVFDGQKWLPLEEFLECYKKEEKISSK